MIVFFPLGRLLAKERPEAEENRRKESCRVMFSKLTEFADCVSALGMLPKQSDSVSKTNMFGIIDGCLF